VYLYSVKLLGNFQVTHIYIHQYFSLSLFLFFSFFAAARQKKISAHRYMSQDNVLLYFWMTDKTWL